MDPATLGKRLAAVGIPTLRGRTATLRQLVLQAPPSVVAGMLGYHAVHTEAVAAQVGGTWKKYAPATTPSDHTGCQYQGRVLCVGSARSVGHRSNRRTARAALR